MLSLPQLLISLNKMSVIDTIAVSGGGRIALTFVFGMYGHI